MALSISLARVRRVPYIKTMNSAALVTAENIKAVVAAYALYCAGCSWVVFSVASWLRARAESGYSARPRCVLCDFCVSPIASGQAGTFPWSRA